MLEESEKRLSDVGAAMVRAAPEKWKRISLDVTGAGSMTETAVRVEMSDGTSTGRATLDFEGSLACDELREHMYRDAVGTWCNARFTVDGENDLDVEFDYENPPFEGDADEVLLFEDHEMFPRDSEHLPPWHPAKRST